jgi:putative pyruvate formate lyase activating enzyme
MVRQCPRLEYDSEGCLKKGVLVRLLVLPGAVANAKLSLRYLYDAYGDTVLYSIMRQYTPRQGLPPPLSRRVTDEEYEQVVSYALRIGIRDAFTQDAQSATFAYTPPFESLEGVR